VIDEREADAIRSDVARSWLQSHIYDLDTYLDPSLEENRLDWVRREPLVKTVESIALNLIRYAKDLGYTPDLFAQRLEESNVPLPLAQMGAEMYTHYQRALAYRGAVDFDDLIRLALQALQRDPSLLEYLQARWPYILEDEAQDSSQLQESILRLLAGEQGNWVRVGDPNQAIYETFTTANPRYLRQFLHTPGVIQRYLPNSGRSTPGIIHLANYLVHWTQSEHPTEAVRDALQSPPEIEPTPPDDPQPNPPDEDTRIHLIMRKYGPAEEIQAVADSLERWLPENPEATVAVLTPRNQRAFELVNELNQRGIPCHDGMLRSSSATRFSAGALAHLLRYLADGRSAGKLAKAYEVWRRNDRGEEAARALMEQAAELLRKITHVEDFIWPGPHQDWLAETGLEESSPEVFQQLEEFRTLVRRWQAAVVLPIDQIVLTLAQDLLEEPAELALAHKLALLLRRASQEHPDWQINELTSELAIIAKNERRFLGFSEEDSGFDPEKHKGVVVVSTLHKAKGLEWDRVYLMSVNNYDFPSGMGYDQYISEKWFIRDHLNLEAEALAQVDILHSHDQFLWYEEGQATAQARLDYIRERLRLLYVGITRARKELVITWNSGRSGETQPAIPLVALQGFLEK